MLRQLLEPLGTGEDRPLGPQAFDLILLGHDLMADLEDLLGEQDGLVFDRIGIDGRADQDRDRDEVQ